MMLLVNAFWELSMDMGVYILFGLLAAGVLHQLISEDSVRRHLGKNTHNAVLKAALFGAPLPLCSCSVIPFASSLRRSGASRGATLSFLISTPITGIDSILATFGMFGWVFTLYRLITSVIIAITAGILMNIFEKQEVQKVAGFSLTPPVQKQTINFSKVPEPSSAPFSIKAIFYYGFVTLFSGFSKPLFWGLLIGAMITAALPTNLHELFSQNRVLGYLIAVAIAAPMYVCATASLPIAASLIMAGVSPGAAFIFLSAGPATNTVTMGVVKSILGMRALVIYLGVIVLGSLAFGVLVDFGFETLKVSLDVARPEQRGLVEQLSAIVLLGLIGGHFLSGFLKKEDKSCSGGSCCS